MATATSVLNSIDAEQLERIKSLVETLPDGLTDYNEEEVSKEDILNQILEFPTQAPVPVDIETYRYLTVASVVSPSLDRDMRVFPGKLSAAEVVATVFNESPEWWGAPETIEITDIAVYEVNMPAY